MNGSRIPRRVMTRFCNRPALRRKIEVILESPPIAEPMANIVGGDEVRRNTKVASKRDNSWRWMDHSVATRMV